MTMEAVCCPRKRAALMLDNPFVEDPALVGTYRYVMMRHFGNGDEKRREVFIAALAALSRTKKL